MERNHLKQREGDHINAVLAAAGYNFGLLLRWLAELLHALIPILTKPFPRPRSAKSGATRVLHERLDTLSFPPKSSRRSHGKSPCLSIYSQYAI